MLLPEHDGRPDLDDVPKTPRCRQSAPLKSEKAVLLPHMGSATIEGREKVIINIKTWVDGHKPPGRVKSLLTIYSH
jgi:lactate dehydrogenase-like 2-hydroxyacid dehydrogenase